MCIVIHYETSHSQKINIETIYIVFKINKCSYVFSRKSTSPGSRSLVHTISILRSGWIFRTGILIVGSTTSIFSSFCIFIRKLFLISIVCKSKDELSHYNFFDRFLLCYHMLQPQNNIMSHILNQLGMSGLGSPHLVKTG